MQKILPHTLSIIAIVLSASCTTKKKLLKSSYTGKLIDNQLVGKWAGSEFGQQEKDVSKEWVMKRNKNGSYFIWFKQIKNDKLTTIVNDGIWWIDVQGRFNEFDSIYGTDSSKIDTYDYDVVDKNTIKFKGYKLRSQSFTNENYEFIDSKIKSLPW